MSIKPFVIAKSLTNDEWKAEISQRPKNVIGQNSKLKKTKFFQWTLPALTASVLDKGELKVMKTCPMAGACANACYACQGGYVFKSSMVAHTRNLQYYLDDSDSLALDIIDQIKRKKSIRAFRIHDSGDFFNREYAMWWLNIINQFPSITFYAYTKNVSMFKAMKLEGIIPANFTIIYSYGGKQDNLINPKIDRHAKVFATHEDMIEAGYADTTKTDEKASQANVLKIGLVYHGVLNVNTALNNKIAMAA